jgi:hypothetical protein
VAWEPSKSEGEAEEVVNKLEENADIKVMVYHR